MKNGYRSTKTALFGCQWLPLLLSAIKSKKVVPEIGSRSQNTVNTLQMAFRYAAWPWWLANATSGPNF